MKLDDYFDINIKIVYLKNLLIYLDSNIVIIPVF